MVDIATSNRPAILGGEKAITMDPSRIADANRWPIITEEEVQAVSAVLRSGELSINPNVYELEDDYRELLGVRHALACCNGTSGIFAALHSFGLHPGDEVIVPSATYWASVMPVLWCGAVPVFCESESEQLGLNPDDVERKITTKTRAMIVVHLWGMPSKMDRLLEIAKRHRLKVFEDASHAHGAVWNNKRCGTLGDAAVFSLQTNKLAPAGEGGVLVTDDDTIFEHAQCLGHFERILPMQTAMRRFAGTGFGQKHRMSPLSAAIARVQLKHMEERNARRNENIEYLSRQLEPLGFDTFLAPAGVHRVYFLYLIKNDESKTGLTTERLVEALRAEGCDVVGPRYPLLHQQPVFTEDRFIEIARLQHLPRESLPTYSPDALPQTVQANKMLLQLPSFPSANRELLDQYAVAFRKVVGACSEIAAIRPGSP